MVLSYLITTAIISLLKFSEDAKKLQAPNVFRLVSLDFMGKTKTQISCTRSRLLKRIKKVLSSGIRSGIVELFITSGLKTKIICLFIFVIKYTKKF